MHGNGETDEGPAIRARVPGDPRIRAEGAGRCLCIHFPSTIVHEVIDRQRSRRIRISYSSEYHPTNRRPAQETVRRPLRGWHSGTRRCISSTEEQKVLESRDYLRLQPISWREPRCSATLRASQHLSILAAYRLQRRASQRMPVRRVRCTARAGAAVHLHAILSTHIPVLLIYIHLTHVRGALFSSDAPCV